MNLKTVLPVVVCLALTLHAAAASAQYISRPRSTEVGMQAGAWQGADGNTAGLGLAFTTYLSGDSLLKSADGEDWEALSPNLSLRVGDRVWAQDDARIEIRFPRGATAWVNYQSELDITRMERGGRAETIQLALVSGEAAFDVKGFARTGSVFQVDIPDASIRAFRAARFRVNTLPDGTAQIGVISGSLVLETPDGLTDVSGGHMAEIQPDRRILLDFLPASDEWDEWVRSRAEIYDRPAASVRYLPADLSPYAHEFDISGRWTRDPTYGSVWVPAVDRSWSPYSNGRWVWQANDYVWLSFDPWYAPFHYGRWSWGVSIGWFWIVPQGRAYWSPGYVGWSVIGDEVSWVPLGRGETYYGYGDYGSGSVNVNKTTTINVTNVYVNSKVTNGVVAVRRDDFLRGKIARERIAPAKNPFQGGVGGVKVLGKPPVREIKPIRETRQARPEVEVKRTTLPPLRLEKASQNIRQRVVAPTKEKSVFKPGNKPAPLRNIVKEKQLEQWVAPKSMSSPTSVAAPPPARRQGRDVAPPAQPAPKAVQRREVQQPAPKAVHVRQPQPPAGKRQFKRVLEPPQGGTNVAPAPAVGLEEQRKRENEKEQEELKKGKGSGSGKRK